MKPTNLCLVQMGKTGLEVVSSYPNSIPNEVLSELAYKSVPMTAKPGDFATASMNDLNLTSLVFEVPSDTERNNIASLVAVFSKMDYNINEVKKVFSVIVQELKSKDLLKIDVIKSILPNLHDGLKKGKFTIEISSTAKIAFDFQSEDERDDKSVEKRADNVSDDLWR